MAVFALFAFSWHCRKLCSFFFLPYASLYLFHRIITKELYFWSNFLRRKNNFKGVFQISRGMNVWPSRLFLIWVFGPLTNSDRQSCTITVIKTLWYPILSLVLRKTFIFLAIYFDNLDCFFIFSTCLELLDLTWLNCIKDSMFKPNKSLEERHLTGPQQQADLLCFQKPGVLTKCLQVALTSYYLKA